MPLRAPLSCLTLLPLAAALLISGCQTPSSLSENGLPTHTKDPMQTAPPITRGLDAEGLRTLLTAEIAGQRGDYRLASQGYLEAAQRYQAPALAERATFAARLGNDLALIETSALRWRELDPSAETANRLLASLSLQRGDWYDSLEQRLAIAQTGGYGEIATFAELAVADDAPLSLLLQRLYRYLETPGVAQQETYSDVLLGTALIEAALGNIRQAQQRLDDIVQREPASAQLWLAKAKLSLESGDPIAAQHAARQGLEIAPDDIRFVLLLAQAEIRLNNIAAAETHTDTLLETHSGNQDLRIALAQLYLEEGHSEPAYRLLQPLIGQETIPNMAYFLLGAIAQSQGEIDDALLYYRQVRDGDEFLATRATAAQMLIEEDRLLDARALLRIERMRHDAYFGDLVLLEVQLLDELGLQDDATDLLNRELARTPNDTTLLYLRAMRFWEFGDIAAMKQDLQQILRAEPDHAMALNALGYTLADLNLPGRLEEAHELIERAYELEPSNPAILDSMGWVFFRLGQPEEALPWLESAYAQMPDQEIAAHLAEVLHTLGRSDEARRIIQQIRQRTNEHPHIDELLQRIPELTPPAAP